MPYGPCGCRCGGGGICVDLTASCHAVDNDGVSVVVKDHATEDVVATGTTDADGHVCFDVPPGAYDVEATKGAGCLAVAWDAQTVSGGTLHLAGDMVCNSGRTVRVFGCLGLPLPGATVTISGPESAVLTTGADGRAYFFPTKTGTFTVVVTHPSGRFKSVSGAWTQASLCALSNVNYTLVAATGFSCCGVLGSVLETVYPIPNTLTLTDPGGTSTVAGACGGTVCVDRTMSDVGATDKVFVTCSPSGTGYVPPVIGAGSSPVRYQLSFGATGMTAIQINLLSTDAASGGLHYHAAYGDDGKCLPQDTYRTWRIAGACPLPSAPRYQFNSTGCTVNSIMPLNVTIHFQPGDGFGPSPTPLNATPYAADIVVSEA